MEQGFVLKIIDHDTHPALGVLRQLLREYQQAIGVDLCFQGFERELASLPGLYAPPDGRLYIAWCGDEPTGCVALRRHDALDGEMKRLYVRPAFRQQGLGRVLAERVIEDARQIGYRRLLLDTLPSMASARALYAQLGFEQTQAYVFNPIAGVSYMSLTLGEA